MVQKIFKREIIGEIERYLHTGDIIVLHGARQVGKTSLLHYFEAELKAKGGKTYFIDLEDSRYVRILDAGVEEFMKLLAEEGIKAERPGKKVYVFVDEIQYLANPSSFLKLIADHHKAIKLIVSGSSALQSSPDSKTLSWAEQLISISLTFHSGSS